MLHIINSITFKLPNPNLVSYCFYRQSEKKFKHYFPFFVAKCPFGLCGLLKSCQDGGYQLIKYNEKPLGNKSLKKRKKCFKAGVIIMK
jgi:hypothetical protein